MESQRGKYSSLIAGTTSRGSAMGRPLLVTRFYECGLPKRIVGGTMAGEKRGKNGVESVDQYLDSARAQRRFRLLKIPAHPSEICSRIFVVPSSFLLTIIPLFLVSPALSLRMFLSVRFKTVWDKSVGKLI